MSTYFRLTLISGAAFYEGRFREDGWFLGQRVGRDDAETLRTDDFIDAAGTERITHHLIQPKVILKAVEYWQDLKYGGLTRKSIEQQKKEYGLTKEQFEAMPE